jgi:hypothetical protein
VQQSTYIAQNNTENVPQDSLCHSEILCMLQSYQSVYGAYFLTHIGRPHSLYPSSISVAPMVTTIVSTLRVESN